MRKFILVIFCLEGLFAFSQLTKNTFYVGGFYNSTNSFTPYNKVNLSPSVGYMLSDKWALGSEFCYGHKGLVNEPYYRTISVNLNSRYYFHNAERFTLYGAAAIGYSKTKYDYYDKNSFSQNVYVSYGLGASFFISNKLSLDLQTNYVINSHYYNRGLEGKIGLHYYFRK